MKRYKVASLLLSVMLAVGLLVGCGGKNTNTDAKETTQPQQQDTGTKEKEAQPSPVKEEPPTEISVMTMLWGEPPDVDKSPFFQELMKRTNTKLSIQMIPSNVIMEKLTLALASRQLPDLVNNRNMYDPTIVNYINQGAFTDLSALLGDFSEFPNLKKIPQQIWDNAKVNGKDYSIPNPRGLTNQSMMIRQDWLDALGLPMPTTIDEYTNVLRAFKTKDPDQNGKDDTYGLNIATASMGAAGGTLAAAFGVHTPVVEDGKLLFSWMTSSYEDYLKYMKGLYDEGLVSKEYVVLKDNKTFYQGKYGSIGIPLTSRFTYEEETKKLDPKINLVTIPPLQGPGGYASVIDIGYYGNFMIPASVSKEKAIKILKYLDRTYTDDISDLRNYGIEGQHYNVVDGKKVINQDAYTKDVGNIQITVGLFDPYSKAVNAKAPDSVNEEQKKISDMYYEKAEPMDPISGLISDTYLSRGSEIFKDRDTMVSKVVMGKAEMSEWTQYVDKMKADPDVQKMMKEFYEQHELKTKK